MTEDEFNAQSRGQSKHRPELFRMLPASEIAERGTICSFILAPKEVAGHCTDHGIVRSHFHNPTLGEIYLQMVNMIDAGKPLDVVTLTQELADRNILESVGGASLISELYTYLPTATNVSYYIEILKEKRYLRSLIECATEYASRAYEEQDDVWSLKDRFEQSALAIGDGKERVKFTTSKTAVMNALAVISDTYERRGSVTGLTTGFHDFDKLTNGLQNAEMIVIAARPSQGKTAFAMNIVEHIGVTLQRPVGVFSLEMSTTQLKIRMICSRARINLSRMRDGYLADRDFPAMTAAASELSEAPIFYDESSDLTIQEFRARARRMKAEHGVVAIFIDYLQLMRSNSPKSRDNREREVSECSAGIKAAAKELGIPIVVLAQISRKFEERGPQSRPRLADLRESGAIEQDADLVAFLIRAETYAQTEQEKDELAGQAEVIVAKHRSGPTGDVALTFLKEFTRFEDRASVDAAEEADAAQAKLDYGSPV